MAKDSGTFGATLTPAPGVLGKQETFVTEWEASEKLLSVMQRTVSKLPSDVREEFASLLTPESVAVTAAALTVWAASHAFGVGELATIGFLLWGAYTVGIQVTDVAKEFAGFLKWGLMAQSEEDLDVAAGHLSNVVTIVGVTVFVSMVMKTAWKFRSGLLHARIKKLKQAAQIRMIEQKMRAGSPIQKNGATKGYSFFKKWQLKMEEMTGIDFSKPVEVKQLNQTTAASQKQFLTMELLQRVRVSPDKVGNWFTQSGVSAEQTRVSIGLKVQVRQTKRYRLRPEVVKAIREGKMSLEVLECRASSGLDEWTVKGEQYGASGGGIQWIFPDQKNFAHQFPDGLFEEVSKPGS